MLLSHEDLAALGDPEGMRAFAGWLRGEAARLDARAERRRKGAEALVFVGPAGDRFRAEAAERATTARSVAEQLVGASQALVRAAAQVEIQIDALRRLMAERSSDR